MYKRIVVAVDISHGDLGGALLEKGVALLDEGGEIILLHVLEDVPAYIASELPRDLSERRRAEASVELKTIAGGVGAGVKVMTEVRHGPASGEILACAKDAGADLVMIASHRPGFQDYFIGSTAARVVRHSQCSVLISR